MNGGEPSYLAPCKPVPLNQNWNPTMTSRLKAASIALLLALSALTVGAPAASAAPSGLRSHPAIKAWNENFNAGDAWYAYYYLTQTKDGKDLGEFTFVREGHLPLISMKNMVWSTCGGSAESIGEIEQAVRDLRAEMSLREVKNANAEFAFKHLRNDRYEPLDDADLAALAEKWGISEDRATLRAGKRFLINAENSVQRALGDKPLSRWRYPIDRDQ